MPEINPFIKIKVNAFINFGYLHISYYIKYQGHSRKKKKRSLYFTITKSLMTSLIMDCKNMFKALP